VVSDGLQSIAVDDVLQAAASALPKTIFPAPGT
jgi:hypothetical protein